MVAGIVDDGRQQEEEEGVGVEAVLSSGSRLGEVEGHAHQDTQRDEETRLGQHVRQLVVQVEAWGNTKVKVRAHTGTGQRSTSTNSWGNITVRHLRVEHLYRQLG